MQTHELEWSIIGSRKNRKWVSRDGYSLMRFSKYFYDRPSAQGFKKGLGIIREGEKKDVFFSSYANEPTAFKCPGFKNGEQFLVGLDFDGNTPFYFRPYFLVFLNFIGLAHVTLILVLCSIPGQNRFLQNGKKLQLKVPKILLF